MGTDSQTQPIKILIADLHPIFRAGLRRLLGERPTFTVVGEASNAREVVEHTSTLRPDLLLLDIAIMRKGFDTIREISPGEGSPHILLLSATIERAEIAEALLFGARGVFQKESGTDLLLKSITTVMKGQYWVGRENVSDLISHLRDQPSSRPAVRNKFGLTPRELQVVGAVASGCTNKEVARQLTLAEDTVKHHLSRIFDKVGAFNRLELALFALDNGLVDREPSTK